MESDLVGPFCADLTVHRDLLKLTRPRPDSKLCREAVPVLQSRQRRCCLFENLTSPIDSAGLTDDEDVRSLVGVFSILGGNSADHADLPRENVRRLTNVINDVGCIACPEVAEHPVHRYGERANRRVEYGRVAATALRVSPVIHA